MSISAGKPPGTTEPLLSFCIATYKRPAVVVALVTRLLHRSDAVQVCVHVDGIDDKATDLLSQIDDPRLSVTSGENQGRAGALAEAVSRANGRFTMLFDDDDHLSDSGLTAVLADCASQLPSDAIGYIYHLEDENCKRVGSPFPVARSNLVALRADHQVTGDKKEVVLTRLLKDVVLATRTLGRRVPTSLYWCLISLQGDVVCRNTIIGTKNYLAGGMTDNIRTLKASNPKAMALLYYTQFRCFAHKRYRSPRFVLRAILGLLWYGAASLTQRAASAMRPNLK